MEGLKALGAGLALLLIALLAAGLLLWGGWGMVVGIYQTAKTQDGWRWLVALGCFFYYAHEAEKREKALQERIERLEARVRPWESEHLEL